MLSFQTRQENLVYEQKALIVAPVGEIDKRSVRQFEKQMQDYYNIGYRFLILDCANIQSIGSEGLENILNLVETFQQAGGILLIVQALTQISRFFDLNGYSPIFTSFSTDNEAIHYLTEQLKQAYDGEAMGTDTVNLAAPPITQEPAMPASSSPMSAAVPTPVESRVSPASAYSKQKQSPTSMAKNSVSPFPKININIQYYKIMNRFGIYPLTVELIPPEKYRGAHTLDVSPLFPGCLSVPLKRNVALKNKEKITFWLTAFTSRKMQANIEFSRDQKIFRIPLPCKGTQYRASKLFLLLALVIPLSLRWNLLAIHTWVDKILLKFPFTLPVQYLGSALVVVFVSLAFLAFLVNRARKAKPVLSRLNFQ